MRKPSFRPLFESDIKKAVSNIDYVKPKIRVIETLEQLGLLAQLLSQAESFAWDLETSGFDYNNDVILCFSFSMDGKVGYVVPWMKNGTIDHFTFVIAFPYLKQILESPAKKIGQNLYGFDLKFTRKMGINVTNYYFDTLIASHLVNENVPHDLNALITTYTNLPRYDTKLSTYLPNQSSSYALIPNEVLWEYAGYDAIATFLVYKELEKELEKENLMTLFREISMPLTEVLHDMEWYGVLISKEKALGYQKLMDDEILEITTKVYDSVGKEFNLNSVNQLRDVLYKDLKLSTSRKTAKNADSTSSEALEELNHPVAKCLLRYRELNKIKTTYLSSGTKGLLGKLDANNRVHPQYVITGTTTGRLSCLEENTLIITKRGLIPIKDVKIGDDIGTQYGFKQVLNVFRGKKSHMRSLNIDGRQILASPEHKFYTHSGEFIEADKIDMNTILVGSHNNFFIDGEYNLDLLEEEAEFLGYFIGDGCFRWRVRKDGKIADVVHIAASPRDSDDLREYFSKIISKVYKKDLKWLRTQTCFTGRIMSTDVAARVLSLCGGELSHGKIIPQWMYTQRASVICAFLRGLFEADGYVSFARERGRTIGFCSVSKSLVFGVSSLLDILGIRTYVTYVSHEKGAASVRGIWRLRLKGAISKQKFFQYIGFISFKKKHALKCVIETELFHDSRDTFKLPSLSTQYFLNTLGRSGGISRSFVKGLVGNQFHKIVDLVYDFVNLDQYHVSPKSVEDIYGEFNVCDVEVEGVSQYVVNGLICHNSKAPNIHQTPRNYVRGIFVAPEGYSLVESDYISAELMMAAYYSRCQALIDKFNAKEDVLKWVASLVFNKPLEIITKQERQYAKYALYGICYMRGPQSLADQFGLTFKQGLKIIDTIFLLFPELKQYQNAAIKLAKEKGVLTNVYGRKRRFEQYDIFYSEMERQAVNTLIQGSVADTAHKAIIDLHREIKNTGLDAHIVIYIHDGIISEIRDDLIPQYLDLATKCMEREVPKLNFVMRVEHEVSKYWKPKQ